MYPPKPTSRNRIILGHHLVPMGYAHWLPNEIRDGGSDEVRKDLISQLGEIHPGRKRIQPSRTEPKANHRRAAPLCQDEVLWFDGPKQSAIAQTFGVIAKQLGHVIWACAVLPNHAHLVVKRHAHRRDVKWRTFAEAVRQAHRVIANGPSAYRVWGESPFSRFPFTPQDIRSRVDYVRQNPIREGLSSQHWSFIQRQVLTHSANS